MQTPELFSKVCLVLLATLSVSVPVHAQQGNETSGEKKARKALIEIGKYKADIIIIKKRIEDLPDNDRNGWNQGYQEIKRMYNKAKNSLQETESAERELPRKKQNKELLERTREKKKELHNAFNYYRHSRRDEVQVMLEDAQRARSRALKMYNTLRELERKWIKADADLTVLVPPYKECLNRLKNAEELYRSYKGALAKDRRKWKERVRDILGPGYFMK